MLRGERGEERGSGETEGNEETEERTERMTLALKLEDSKVIDLVGGYSDYSLIYMLSTYKSGDCLRPDFYVAHI